MKKASTRKHATRTWRCPLCGRLCRGNGGRASHQRSHMLAGGVGAETITSDHHLAWRRFVNNTRKDET